MSRPLLILAKDLRVLLRSPLLLALLLVYPLVIAALLGLVAGYANTKPRVAFVDEDAIPATVQIGGADFDVAAAIERADDDVRLVPLGAREAERQLDRGGVVAILTVPSGFVSDLRSLTRRPRLVLETTRGGVAPRVRQQVRALVYSLNRELQDAFIVANLRSVDVIRKGGTLEFFGRRFEVLGFEGTRRLLTRLPPGVQRDRVLDFVGTAEVALGQTDEVLRATANPVELEVETDEARSWVLSAQVQAYGLALTTGLLALVLAAGALAAERDEGVLGRLARGLVRLGQLVAAKIALAALVAVVVGMALALVFGVAVEVRDVRGGEPWARLPLVALGLALAGASLGAVGALLGAIARESRTASLAALLVVLPMLFLGLVPRELLPAAGYVSDALPFAHAVRFFAAALYESEPWRTLAVEAAWLAALCLVFGAAARAAMRRLLV